MYFFYIDDSGDADVYGYSALGVLASSFRQTLLAIKGYRKSLRISDGIFINKEFHAVDFCAGRGRIGGQVVTKWRRCQIFRETLAFVATLPNVKLFNAFGRREKRLTLLERLINRINASMRESKNQAVLIFDEGEERAYTKLVRKMGVFNLIRSAYGSWPDGNEYKNIPVEFIIEDPHFRRSRQSYFIQLADFCGYALLQRERPSQNPKRARFNLHETFEIVSPICVREANRRDAHGVVRL